MASSFLASAATRVHPSEWTSGTAAGAAATLMAQRGWSSADMYDNVHELQALLQAPPLAQPLQWVLP